MYAPSLVSNPRDERSPFIIGLFNDLVDEFILAMHHENMDISRLIEYAQQFNKTQLKRKNKDLKREKSY